MELKEVKKGTFIYEIENCLGGEFCSDLIRRFNEDHRVYEGVTHEGYQPRQKKTKDLLITGLPEWTETDFQIFEVTRSILQVIAKQLPYMLHNDLKDSGYKIGMYEPGDGFQLHSDQFANRRTVIMWYLNTIEKGGETVFPNQEVSIRPIEGKMLLFPACWTHLHEGKPPVSNRKYIMTTWLL